MQVELAEGCEDETQQGEEEEQGEERQMGKVEDGRGLARKYREKDHFLVHHWEHRHDHIVHQHE